ncbi:MAG: 3-oxoacyl-ACP reductase FabG [Christensenellaceae bacterium]|nr:3-oxoacyl-ACP reductase FabG [Christensenellaceae bacterium]
MGISINKTVLITGGAGGIGQSIVEGFAELGYEIYLSYLTSEAEAINLKQKLAGKANIEILKADLRDHNQIKTIIEYILQKTGKIDIIVNNAGASLFGLFTDHSIDEIKSTLDINLTGLINLTQCVVRSMISEKYGRIINISSIWGLVGASCEVVYSAAKAGVIGFTKALAKELGPSGITVNCVAPGLVMTRMNSDIDVNTINDIIESTPLRRAGLPYDVSNAVLFLASDRASFITGQTIVVDGGYAL